MSSIWNGSVVRCFEYSLVHTEPIQSEAEQNLVCCKVNLFSSLFFCLQNNILFALHLVHLPSWLASFRASSIPCTLLPSHPEFSSLETSEEVCVPNYNDLPNCILYLRCDLHDLLVEWIPNAFSWIHELPRCMHAFVFLDVVGFITLAYGFPQLL